MNNTQLNYQACTRKPDTNVTGSPSTPGRHVGEKTTIRYALFDCWMGWLLAAETEHGVCAILPGDDPDALVENLGSRFPTAKMIRGDAAFDSRMFPVIKLAESPSLGLALPLDIRGTDFQQRVWSEVRKIPPGVTVACREIAIRIGQPTAARAVAGACRANPLAIAVSCHRVVGADGGLCGYRWGLWRKAELLRREREANLVDIDAAQAIGKDAVVSSPMKS